MAAEMDPIFVRALQLLHSRHPKSLEQLCALRDEVLGKKSDSSLEIKKEDKDVELPESSTRQTNTVSTTETNQAEPGDTKNLLKDIHDASAQSVLSKDSDSVTETVEIESSSLSTSTKQHDEGEMIETVEEVGFLETLEEITSSSLLLSKPKKAKLDGGEGKSAIMEEVELASRESSPDQEITADLRIHCIICMSGKTSMVGNQLVECHECHEHYHQNCHKPNITDQNINDPRHVWYCSSCMKRMKEATTTTTTATKSKSLISPGLSFKSPTQSFKQPVRIDGKPPSFSPNSGSVNQSFSIASLSGNTSNNNSSSSSGSLKSPNNAYPRDVTRNSMKRLQMVKKKAAAKNQQRFAKR